MNQGSCIGNEINIDRNASVFAKKELDAPTNAYSRQDAAVSSWTSSFSKRLFDCFCVLLALPVLMPVFLAVALAVKFSSKGPILFIQRRMGLYGRTFPILKFRTMEYAAKSKHFAVTTMNNQKFTPCGPFLRRWKLDELPQLLNVLAGHMSLVGPRPKLPEHSKDQTCLYCRPGITGAATVAFAREEALLAKIPSEELNTFYHQVVLPAKIQMDAEYMAKATFSSDFCLLVNTVLRRWNNSIWDTLYVRAKKYAVRKSSPATAYASNQLREYIS